jgi:hypothetical protein
MLNQLYSNKLHIHEQLLNLYYHYMTNFMTFVCNKKDKDKKRVNKRYV